MSWDNRTLLTRSEVEATSSIELPSAYQLGQKVLVTFFLAEAPVANGLDEYFQLPATVIEVRFNSSTVRYAVAISIGNDLYVKYNEVVPSDISLPDENPRSTECIVPLSNLPTYLKKLEEKNRICIDEGPKLSLIVNNRPVIE